MNTFDAIVIGLGGMGSAAIYHLARRGCKALGLEQFEIGHARGSSHGQTRIIRRAYFEHPDYVPLVNASYAGWREIESECGTQLFRRVGLILWGPPDGAVITGVQRAAREHSLDIRDVPSDHPAISRDGVRRFEPSAGDVTLWEPEAGYLRVEQCVRAFVERAMLRGGQIAPGVTVRHWKAEPRSVTVETDQGSYSAARLIICGGAWSGRLLADLGSPLEVRRKVQLWFACDGRVYAEEHGSPVFACDAGGAFFYGFPSLDRGVLKVAEHTGRQIVDDPSQVDQRLHDADHDRVRAFVARHLPHVTPQVVRHSVCMYTMTPDEHFILDQHPQYQNVFFAAGFSGHGFKFAPLIGSVLSELALDGRTGAPIEFLSASRAALGRNQSKHG